MGLAVVWERERAIYDVAHRQFGLFTAEHWYQMGLSRDQLKNRLRRGHVRRVANKIYALNGAPETNEFRIMYGCMRAGPLAAASHGTAAALWGLIQSLEDADTVHVSGPRNLKSMDGYRFHRVYLDPAYVVTRDGLPVTDVARTLLDACAELYERRSGRLIDRALQKGLTSVDELIDRVAAERRRGRSGVAAMCKHIESRDPSNVKARSLLEQDVFDLLVRSGFPTPERNYLFASEEGFPWELDLYWPEHKLVIEVDAYATHGSFESFYKDRDKDLDLESRGLRVLHVTDEMARRESKLVSLLEKLLPRA